MLSTNMSPNIMDFEVGWHYVASVAIKDRHETIEDQFDGPDDPQKAELIALYLAGDLVMETRGSIMGVSITIHSVRKEE